MYIEKIAVGADIGAWRLRPADLSLPHGLPPEVYDFRVRPTAAEMGQLTQEGVVHANRDRAARGLPLLPGGGPAAAGAGGGVPWGPISLKFKRRRLNCWYLNL